MKLARLDLRRGKSSTSGLWLILAVFVVVMLYFVRPTPSVDLDRLPPLDVEGWLNTEGDVTRKSLAGQVVLVDCFATWCGPCRLTMPDLVELRQRFADQDVQVVGLTPEETAEAETVAEYVASVEGLDWPIGYGADATMKTLGAHLLPTYLVFDRRGKHVVTANHLSEAEEAVVQALAR